MVVTTHSMGVPWPWLGVYGSTKAALAELARALRSEEPHLRVLCVAVGNTASSFADNWDPEVAGQAFEQWVADGLLRYEVLQCDEMADAILAAVLDPTHRRRSAHRGRRGVEAGASAWSGPRSMRQVATRVPSAVLSIFSMAVRGSSSVRTMASGSL